MMWKWPLVIDASAVYLRFEIKQLLFQVVKILQFLFSVLSVILNCRDISHCFAPREGSTFPVIQIYPLSVMLSNILSTDFLCNSQDLQFTILSSPIRTEYYQYCFRYVSVNSFSLLRLFSGNLSVFMRSVHYRPTLTFIPQNIIWTTLLFRNFCITN